MPFHVSVLDQGPSVSALTSPVPAAPASAAVANLSRLDTTELQVGHCMSSYEFMVLGEVKQVSLDS